MTVPVTANHSKDERIARLERRLAREREARLAAEATAETGLRQLYEHKLDLELIGKVSARANSEEGTAETFAFTLQAVLERTGWSFGAVCCVGDGTDTHSTCGMTRQSSDAMEPLRHFVERTGIDRSEEHIRRAIDERRPIVVEALNRSDIAFARRIVASKCGIRSVIAVPVQSGENVVAIMEFMSVIEGAANENMLELLQQVAAQVARVHEREEMSRRLLHDALHDPLTGLANRQLFDDRLNRAVEARRRHGADYAVLFLDLDRFKAINDSLGHAVGDAALIAFARILTDLASTKNQTDRITIARMGGDEFCFLIEDDRAEELAPEIADGILGVLSNPVTIGRHSLGLGASIGIAVGRDAHTEGDAVVRDADAAMYAAKTAGRSQTRIYTEEERHHDTRLDALLHEMRAAAKQDYRGFSFVFQPIISLCDSKLSGFEALARWTRANGESVPPNEFIPIAEDHGLIDGFGTFAIEVALNALRRFKSERPTGDRLTMSVNVSARQLSPGFAERIAAILARNELRASELILEITESVTLDDHGTARQTIAELKALGIALSIDDFGTGYSTFSYLRRFPFHTLKIDRSFIGAVGDQTGGLDIVKAMIDVARSLGISVVAEGAENLEHVDVLKALGCDYAQGFFFAPGLTAEAAVRYLQDDEAKLRLAA